MRLDYGRCLMPEEGWTVSWAIGTTYSLDLEVLLSVPLALFHGKYLTDSVDGGNLRIDMLDALMKVRERMFVFVQENNLLARGNYSMLTGFLDGNIWNFKLENSRMSFHPKIWLVRYERNLGGESEYSYRLLVMSRNITRATDFDIAVRLDGENSDKESDANAPLIEMIKLLIGRADKSKGQRIDSERRSAILKSLDELKRVVFKAPERFDSTAVRFLPQRFGSAGCVLDDESLSFDDLLIVSPFIDKEAIGKLGAKTSGRKMLVSREAELDKLPAETLAPFECYQWSSMLENAADYEENSSPADAADDGRRSISLHAKMYIGKTCLERDRKARNYWFVGSTNCTMAGFRRNYEAMLRLRSEDDELSAGGILGQLADSGLVEPYSPKPEAEVEPGEADRQRLREIVFRLSQLDFAAQTVDEGGVRYAVTAGISDSSWSEFRNFCMGAVENTPATVTLSSYSASDSAEKWNLIEKRSHSFKAVACERLSPYLRARVECGEAHKEFLLRLPLEMPEERRDRILGQLLDSREKWMSYILFCLDPQTDDAGLTDRRQVSGSGDKDDALKFSEAFYPMYERLLLAASRDPEALRRVAATVARLENVTDGEGKLLLGDEFKELWKPFAPYVKKKRRGKHGI